MPMVHSVRLGFATNSSSSHSLLLLEPGSHLKDRDVEKLRFGGDQFTAASAESRSAYVALHIKYALMELVGEELAILIVKSLTGIDVSDGYIDHQSVYSLPLARDGRNLDMAFLREFQAFMSRDGLAILGGKDDGSVVAPHPHLRMGKVLKLGLPKDRECVPFVARKDSRGYWAMFSPADGTKVRFSWDGRDVTADKADAPELVDLKITSFCPHACPWCHQASGTGGVHADELNLNTILWSLSSLGVFEVSIGGGEPTCHPHFWSLLRGIRKDMHMVPNFSTRSLDWLYVPEKAAIVREMCGGFAVSATDHRDVDQAVRACLETRMPLEKLGIQYVIGSGHFQAADVMRSCREHAIRCTLLGYKQAGRGRRWKPWGDDWIGPLKEMQGDGEGWPKIGIDTVLAEASEQRLKEMKVARASYEIEDGKFSMYVDAVANTMGPSSYGRIRVPLDSKRDYRDVAKAIQSSFSKW